jgi:hypothetical protein
MGNRPSCQSPTTTTNVSEDRIREVVNRFLENEEVNIGFVPDAVERRIYINVIKILLNLAQEMSKDASVSFLGHEITFTLAPKSPRT